MKLLRALTLLALLAGTFVFPTAAQAAPAELPFNDDTVIFGQEFTLSEGQVIEGSLVAFGSNIIIEEGAVIEDDFVAFGSDIDLQGEVARDMIAIGCDLTLGDSASIGRDLIAPGTSWNRDSLAQIGGDIISETGPFVVNLEEFFGQGGPFGEDGLDIDLDRIRIDDLWSLDVVDRVVTRGARLDPLGNLVWLLIRAIAVSTLGLLVVLFLPIPTRRVLDTINGQPVNSAGIGFVGAIAAPILALVMVITICLIPFAAALILLVAIAFTFGWIALGLEVGSRLMEALKGEWSEGIQAWVGTFMLTLVIGIVGWVPCIGWLAGFVISLLGFGAVLLTRFGTQPYPLEEAVVEAPPAKPAKKSSASKRGSKKS